MATTVRMSLDDFMSMSCRDSKVLEIQSVYFDCKSWQQQAKRCRFTVAKLVAYALGKALIDL